MKGRCVIVGGANITDYAYVRSQIEDDDFLIYCDSGYRHLQGLGADPDLIVGDFDSSDVPETDVETIVLPNEKDDTDTMYAMRQGIERGYDTFLLIGVIGARLDHTLGNVYILEMLHAAGKKGIIIDDYGKIELVTQGVTSYVKDCYSYFSLIAISGAVTGITIKHAKYELDGKPFLPEMQYGVSNEVTPGKTAEITVDEGHLLLIKIRENADNKF